MRRLHCRTVSKKVQSIVWIILYFTYTIKSTYKITHRVLKFCFAVQGNGVHVYVMDTGVNINHSEFGTRAHMLYGATDNNGHGTHCSGTVGGATYGLARQSTIQSVKVCDPGCPVSVFVAGTFSSRFFVFISSNDCLSCSNVNLLNLSEKLNSLDSITVLHQCQKSRATLPW